MAGKAGQLAEKEVDECGSPRVLAEQGLEVMRAEHFSVGVVGLYQAVAVEKDAFSRLQAGFVFLVAHAGHQAKRHAGGAQFRDTSAGLSIGQVVSRVGVVQPPAERIEDSV